MKVDFQNCHSWEHFKSHVKNLPEKQKGNSFEALTKHFLQLHPIHATQLQNIWLLEEVPPKVRRLLNLPEPDEGIDLIAETTDGKYWAIQCKYREDETKSLSRKELSTFTDLAFSICKNIEFALVCTNADRFSHKLRLYGERLGFCTGEVWRGLDAEFFQRLHRHLKGKSSPIEPIKPRPHQTRAIQNAQQYFTVEDNSRGKLVSACGTGKSLTGYWIAEQLKAQTIIVAVPSLALIRQTLAVWTREAIAHQRRISWICVCSDKTVGEFERDDVALLTQDLGIRVHTDPVEIAEWIGEKRDGTTVVFTTYQSGPATAEAAKRVGLVFDVGILDEAHKTTGKKESLFSHLLHDENIEIKKRIFMTATERQYRGQSDEIASMNDPNLYGDTFELLTFKEALECKPAILSDYRIVTILVTRSEVAALIEKNLFVRPDKGRWDKDVEAEMLAAAIALRKAIQGHPIRHAVSFHGSIARARAFKVMQDNFSSALPEYGQLSTFHVSGNTPTAVRSREMDAFASSDNGLVTNARCLTEGVDVPNIDCVMFADPRKSTIDIVQAVGRALRTSQDKELGYVVVPVLLDDGEGNENAIQSNAIDAVLMTLRALAANDDRIVEYFRAISEGRRSREGTTPFEIDVPVGMRIDVESFVDSIELKFWSRLAKLSWRPFEEARDYVRALGLINRAEWRDYTRGELSEKGNLPDDIPAYPEETYKNKGWVSMGDWLGTGTIANFLREFRPFEEAREFVQSLALKGGTEWLSYCKGDLAEKGRLPADVPTNPHRTYRNSGWVSMDDWLGTGRVSPSLREYRPFEEAREYARSLGLGTYKEWLKYCKGELSAKGELPKDIPVSPDQIYKNKGWLSWGDWLGTGAIANFLREYRPFEEAREFAQSLALKGQTEWLKYCKGDLPEKGNLPEDIPARPERTYKNKGWLSMGDWLGTGTVAPFLREYRPFEDARKFAQSLALKGGTEWLSYCKGDLAEKGRLPADVPTNPNKTYKNKGWLSMGDWLGTGTIANYQLEFRPFEEAREFAQSLTLKGRTEWLKYCKGDLPEKGRLPADVPTNPHRTYRKNGWVSWGDWLGTGTIANFLREYRPFEEAREFAQSLALKGQTEWGKYCKGELAEKGDLPEDIPANPHVTYKSGGWISWGDWLGTGTIATLLREYRHFEEAREYVRRLGLENYKEWRRYCIGQLPEKGIRPDDIPTHPNTTYKNKGWLSLGDWLGTGRVTPSLREYRPFEEAREFVRGLRLSGPSEWRQYCKGQLPEKGARPDDIPTNPDKVYKNKGWLGWGDWLREGTITFSLDEFRPFEEAREFVRSLGLSGLSEWKQYCKGLLDDKGRCPEDIPRNPNLVYVNGGWQNWGDWLGTVVIATSKREYRTFEEAREFVRGLGLSSVEEWQKYSKGDLPEKGIRPDDIPSTPSETYKNKGWVNYGGWLGTGTFATKLRQYRPFKEAREYARSLGLSGEGEWRKFCRGELLHKGKLPKDIPTGVHAVYKNQGWLSWGDWLGTGNTAARKRQYRPFEEAREYVHSLGLRDHKEWLKYCREELPKKGKRPPDIPSNPDKAYKNMGWVSWADWLGKDS